MKAIYTINERIRFYGTFLSSDAPLMVFLIHGEWLKHENPFQQHHSSLLPHLGSSNSSPLGFVLCLPVISLCRQSIPNMQMRVHIVRNCILVSLKMSSLCRNEFRNWINPELSEKIGTKYAPLHPHKWPHQGFFFLSMGFVVIWCCRFLFPKNWECVNFCNFFYS